MSKDSIRHLPIPLNPEEFLRASILQLVSTLQEVVGLPEASGFVSLVGQRIGEQVDQRYKSELKLKQLSTEQVAEVLVDVKRRIGGDFYLIEQDEEKIVLGNRACPFSTKVSGRGSLCMMTSNVFGHVVAENRGYGKVVIEQSIAEGHAGCRVVVYLKDSPSAKEREGREYFKSQGNHDVAH